MTQVSSTVFKVVYSRRGNFSVQNCLGGTFKFSYSNISSEVKPADRNLFWFEFQNKSNQTNFKTYHFVLTS